jgi:polysaccharide deacetylase family protein (PEP-CTERM system associated)
MDVILNMLERFDVRATFFWLGWVAERNRTLVKQCADAGHEIASHGYAHLLAYKVGPNAFRDDLVRAKAILEGIIDRPIQGFRAPGFGIKQGSTWAFDIIREVGHTYDSSIFPSERGHGGMRKSLIGPHQIATRVGTLVEIPQSIVNTFGMRIAMFGGGYLRLSPRWLIRLGIGHLHRSGRPMIVYVHPREVDPTHPRLKLSPLRRFKSYVNLKTTLPKLEWICRHCQLVTMGELVQSLNGIPNTEYSE